jgi:hypothetical protein
MATNIFLLGAGASRQAGGPLMRDFLDTAQRVLARDDADLVAVLDGRLALRQIYALATLDLLNVESLLSCFEMAELLGARGGPSEQRLALALRRVITKTLHESVRCARGAYYSFPPEPYGAFVNTVLADLRAAAVITFNYDLALELGMACCEKAGQRLPIFADYGLIPTPPDTYSIPVLKLHGSLNWARCQKCSAIVPWAVTDVVAGDGYYSQRESALRLGERLGELVHCEEACPANPVIVPPTLAKSSHHADLAKVWQRARIELTEVRNLFVIGYSLPETDYFFRYFFGLGTIGAPLKRIWVIDPNPAGVKARFEAFLGPEASPYLDVLSKTFGDAVSDIKTILYREDQYW